MTAPWFLLFVLGVNVQVIPAWNHDLCENMRRDISGVIAEAKTVCLMAGVDQYTLPPRHK